MDKVSKRVTELETVNNNIKLLAEMLQHYSPGTSSEGERDLMKVCDVKTETCDFFKYLFLYWNYLYLCFLLQELYDNLEKERPKLFRLASDTDEKDAEGISKCLRSVIRDEPVLRFT